jgi:hypothetical protein
MTAITPSDANFRGPVEIMAFECSIADGNHNNSLLIERAMDRVAERLMLVQNDLVKAQKALFETARAALIADDARP